MSDKRNKSPDSTIENLLKNSGEMGKLIRAFDWSKTSLGSTSSWPQSLKTAVNIVLQSNLPMVMLWGSDGIMIYNDEYSIFAGKKHPRILGSKVLEGWPEVTDFNRHMLGEVLQGKTLSYKDQKLTLYRNNGPEEVWMNLNYSPLLDEKDKPAGVLAIVIETTQRIIVEQNRKKAEEALKAERQRLYDLFMNAPAGIAIASGPKLTFQLANAPYRQLLGKERSLDGVDLLEAIPEIEPELLQIVKDVAFKGKHFVANELPIKLDWDYTGNPYIKYLNFNYAPLFENDKPNGLMAFVFDVTEMVQAKQLIEENNKKKDEFMGIASHELKTPITSIKASLQIISQMLADKNDNMLNKFVQKAETHVDKLTGLVNDLLDVSKIQAGNLKFNIVQFSIKEIINECVEQVQHQTKELKILIEGDLDVVISGDKVQLEQVLINLLNNAVKYSPKADRIIVKVEKITDFIKISVTDFGIGIPPNNLSNLFERFYRVQHSYNFQGLGLGLYISKQIVNRHGGEIWAESKGKNTGSAFFFTIPISQDLL